MTCSMFAWTGPGRVPITVLIRALGIGTNAEIIDLFGEEPKILASFTEGYFHQLSGRPS